MATPNYGYEKRQKELAKKKKKEEKLREGHTASSVPRNSDGLAPPVTRRPTWPRSNAIRPRCRELPTQERLNPSSWRPFRQRPPSGPGLRGGFSLAVPRRHLGGSLRSAGQTLSSKCACADARSGGCGRPGTAMRHRAHRPRPCSRKGTSAALVAPATLREHRLEAAACRRSPLVRRHLDADDQHLGARGLRGLGHLRRGCLAVFASGKSRKASLAPSSSTTCAGLDAARAGRAGGRGRPSVVSPLMLALTTVAAIFCWPALLEQGTPALAAHRGRTRRES